MTYFIITYGCAMNSSDSERIAAVLEKIGYQPAKNEDSADLVIFNACSVRQSAVDRIFGKIENLKRITHNVKRKTQKYILTGCILETDKHKLQKKFDLIFNIKDLPKLPRLLKKIIIATPPAPSVIPAKAGIQTALIPISTGCNNYCSYCVVPYVRGPEICRPAKNIIREAKRAIKNGAKEIWLLGQNVNSYYDTNSLLTPSPWIQGEGWGEGEKINFPKLLKMINNLPGDFWIKFISSHPKNMSDDSIDAVTECEKVCKYIHLPIQSGDNAILKKMNRRYTVGHYKKLIKKIRMKIPDVAISTDIVVGFPGETKKQFANTAKLMREIKFDMAYLSQYSPRSQTTAFRLKDNVPKQEKKQREYILNEILKKTALKNNQKYIGKTVKVLVERVYPVKSSEGGISPKAKLFNGGKTATHKTVKINPPLRKVRDNQFVSVKIISATPWGLSGKII